MYFYTEINFRGEKQRHIMRHLADGGIQSFHDVESNTGLERQAYLAWVVEGNTAEEWSPEA
jgi:hypothetical protein